MFQETGKRFQETEKMIRETSEQMKETDKRLDKLALRVDETLKTTGRHDRWFGKLVEQLMTPYLHKKFCAWGYHFNDFVRNRIVYDAQNLPIVEVDVFMENDHYAMAVEVKTTLSANDVKVHQQRMEILRRDADEHGDTRKYLGAVAAPAVDKSVRTAAHRMGFFVIEPSEDSVDVIAPAGFKPREW
jgi:hypothetical protein